MSITQKEGIIACNPKEDKPKQFLRNWRPITLLNTSYKIASSCIAASVAVNSQYPSWFQIERDVRQGDPLSPYSYLIYAELMSLMIRTNPRIKGIFLKDISVLLSRCADDTRLYLDGKEESFRESVNVLVRFASMSGLKINFDKTNAVWIGSEKDSKIRFLPHLEF